jgi:hypothetical protein
MRPHAGHSRECRGELTRPPGRGWRLAAVAVTMIAVSLLMVGALSAGGGGLWLRRHVISSGGGTLSFGNTTLKGTVGQPVVGSVEAPKHSVCAGFWCRADVPLYSVYLPLVIR